MTTPAKLTQDTDLAFELALGYFSHDAICLRYGLTLAELEDIAADPGFQILLQDQQRKVDERGDSFRLRARRYAEGVLKQLREIATSQDTSDGLKIKAIDALCRYAGYDGDDQPVAGVQLQIVTNLEVGRATAGNSYVIEARSMAQDSGEDLL